MFILWQIYGSEVQLTIYEVYYLFHIYHDCVSLHVLGKRERERERERERAYMKAIKTYR